MSWRYWQNLVIESISYGESTGMRQKSKRLLWMIFLSGMIVFTNVFLVQIRAAAKGADDGLKDAGIENARLKDAGIENDRPKDAGIEDDGVTDNGVTDDGVEDSELEKEEEKQGKPVRVIRRSGNYYAAYKDKTIYTPQKAEIRKIGKDKYYIRKNGELACGAMKMNGKRYYFNDKGRLQGNIRPIEINQTYYNVNEKGVLKKISKRHAQSEIAAQNFIKAHTRPSSSNSEKFKTCFYYMVGNMCYSPGYYNMREDYKIMEKKDGGYALALQMFQSPVLRGNCHRFANCVAAVAKELGYQPTVIVTTGDHSFVQIDGKYYDNMGALFGTKSRDAYTVYKKFLYT